MSVIDWINANVPNGMNSPFGKLCAADAEGEYGSPANQESALNIIYTLGYDDSAGGKGYQPKRSPVLAGTDEKWHVTGGNDQIITGLVNELPAGTIQLGQKLIAVKKNADCTYTCTFNNGSANHDVVADAVVLAIPFSTLRHVDLSKASISALKMTAIQNMGYGTNSKIMLQFNNRPWNTDKYTGVSLEDTLAAQTWETTTYQPGPQGILLSFPAGAQVAGLASRYGLTVDQGPAPALMASDWLLSFEQIFPGATAAYNGIAYYSIGLLDPHILGAWSNYLIGQYTLFSGVEALAEGGIHFAGEHTSPNFQGFMEGAVVSGERAAGEI